MKKISIIFLILSINFALADVFSSPSNLKNISNSIPKLDNIKCKFKQEKIIKNVSKPLITSGDFEFIKNKGVYFYTTYPKKSTSDYTNEKYKQINDIVNAISNKKYNKLEKEFNFYFEKKQDIWCLGLKPKQNSNAYNYISSILIEGNDYINRISINQVNGNKTSLWFKK